MRYSDIAPLPGTPSEAKNVILDIITVFQAKNLSEVPVSSVLQVLRRQNYDIDKRMLIDLIQDQPMVNRINNGTILLKSDEPEDTISVGQKDLSANAVKNMAKKKLKKEIGK